MSIQLIILIIVAGFAFLVKGADLLVEGASSAAKRMKISELTIGLTVVAIGTSMPELVVNILSTTRNYDDVVFGNIIGSNVFNTLVILGIAGSIYPMRVRHNTVWKEIPYSLAITLILLLLVNDRIVFGATENAASRLDGAVFVLLFVAFLLYVLKQLKAEVDEDNGDVKLRSSTNTSLLILSGIAGISIGGHLVVTYALELTAHFRISEKMIGLTVLSAGTSLPELATTVVAAFRKKNDIAIGNILGSNIFNITLVLGITSMIKPVIYDTVLNTDILVLLGGTFLLFVFMFTLTHKKLDRWEAILLLLCSMAYLYYVFLRN